MSSATRNQGFFRGLTSRFRGSDTIESGTTDTALDQPEVRAISNADLDTAIGWLADAPLFIDGEQITAFYEAVVKPEGSVEGVTISLEEYWERTGGLKGDVGVDVKPPTWFKYLGFADLGVKVGAGGSVGWKESEKRVGEIKIQPVNSPHRQLLHLTLHYAEKLSERMRVVHNPEERGWCDDDAFISQSPRALVFVDFGRGTKFIPMAAEVSSGKVKEIFTELKDKDGKPPPSYPKREKEETDQDYKARILEYWGWFNTAFDPGRSMKAVEEVVGDEGLIQWIAYRVPGPEVDSEHRDGTLAEYPLHLSVCGRGTVNTGVFAYDLIKRGFKHGLRIVGTLKSEPDMNVLAIFEK